MPYVGINIGAVTVTGACLDDDQVRYCTVNHQGRPLRVVDQLVEESPLGSVFGVSGHLGHISEAAATQAAVEHVGGDFDAVASLGGEVFAVYLLEGTRIFTVLSHNKCAAGSGEFFVQQIGRLGLDTATAIDRSFRGKIIPLASRCSVHCKSDITHKLNRQEATTEDVLHTLHGSMADKVVSLLQQAQRRVRRLLVVGGVSQNRAVIASLEDKLAPARVVVLPESPYFEALGTALLTRAEPLCDTPKLGAKPVLETLPPLARYEGKVTRVSCAPPDRSAAGPFVLGVDAGSTTTKAVLMHPGTRKMVASHYARTDGDPLGAARRCLHALADQVADAQICLDSTTGSARDLIGAYLGTSHVYNEISAHAAGAASFDPLVDTIFEIGGQDSKYIFLRNKVPLDYAMNAACSAGTGSFLEECARGDLGLPLTEIAGAALRADTPVQFKATCAAFMNSDIRGALQDGYSREDVAAGLVYSIVRNYLSKVKGRRPIGKKVFFQGGVAMNTAVANAFAQFTGTQVVIPPHPELLGAVGVALLALQRSQDDTAGKVVALAALATAAMNAVGDFTCRACPNQCTIARFKVAGRGFSFGGRCSRFENLRKRKRATVDLDDPVGRRNELVFAPGPSRPQPATGRIGIPRALTTHSLYPLYSTFFRELGLEVVLSGVDSAGWMKANSAFCFPVQIAHGAVLDLATGGTDLIFLPHVNRMPKPEGTRDSYLCPITQASPYFISKAFPHVHFLSPVLNFAHGYEACDAMVEMASSRLSFSKPVAEEAYREAVRMQVETEQSMRRLGQQALSDALNDGQPTIILVGRSYNTFPPEASLSVARKLSSMGIRVIPCDCLPQEQTGPTSWYYPNIIINAVELAKRHPRLFLLYVSNFSCTIDAFIYSVLASKLGSKPYLILEIDAHTADAGIQTRLEAFLDIIQNHRSDPIGTKPFTPSIIGADGETTTSAGRRLPLTDPRVKLYFPTFSHYHCRAVALAARWLGLNVGPTMELDRSHLERGLRYTSGRECLPLPISIGQMLQAHDYREPDEVVGFYMMRGGAPCVVECYADFFRQFIQEHKLEDLFIFDPHEGNNYYGLSLRSLGDYLVPMVTLADVFVEMQQSLRVVGEPGSMELLRGYWSQYVDSATSLKNGACLPEGLSARSEELPDKLAEIPPLAI